MIRFFGLLLVITLVLLSFNYFILEELLNQPFSLKNYLSFTYFFAGGFVMFRYLFNSMNDDPKKFVTRFMAAMGIKIFVSLMILVIYLWVHEAQGKVFAVNFLILYLLYSGILFQRLYKGKKT